MRVVALAGGTGSAKLIRGLSKLPVELAVVANVGDNVWMYGVYVCPDVDIACYTLAGIADRKRGWGIDGDTFEMMSRLDRLGLETWFRLGDRDLANCLARTEMMRSGVTLTEATQRICEVLGATVDVLPVADSHVETRVVTTAGDLHLQEFWVRDHGKPSVRSVRYEGADQSRVTRQVQAVVEKADRIIVCPANPVTSISPMLAVPGFVHMLSRVKAEVIALSPMDGRTPFSGPAGKLMKAMNIRGDSVGVASIYSKFLDRLVISERDAALAREIESIGVKCLLSNTMMRSQDDELRLARELVES